MNILSSSEQLTETYFSLNNLLPRLTFYSPLLAKAFETLRNPAS